MQVGYPNVVPPPPYAEPFEKEPEPLEMSTPVDEDSWRYSRFALPWLLTCFLLLLALLCLTFWQQSGDIKNQYNGVPRIMQLKSIADDDYEAGLPKTLRGLRLAAAIIGFIAIFGAFAVLFARPKRGIRTGLNFLFAVLLLLCAIIAWIAFGVGVNNIDQQRMCPLFRRFTMASCISHDGWAVAAVALDAALGIGALISFLLLAYNTKAGHWKLEPRDWEEAVLDTQERPKERAPGEKAQRNVGLVRKWLTGIALIGTLVVIAALVVFVIVLHEDRETERLLGARGLTHRSEQIGSQHPWEQAGWPTVNTRIRYSAVAMGLIAILFNFLPFRSKTIAIIFGIIYFASAVVCLIAFGWDIHELREHKDNTSCKDTIDGKAMDCSYDPFNATIALDFLCAIWLIIYIVVEYFVMRRRQCQHCDRAYEIHDLIKHEGSECEARPVRCEVCAKSMSFNEFETHKTTCGVDHIRCKHCGIMVSKWGIKSHQSECGRWPVPCSMCDESFQRSDLPHHVVSCNACGETFHCRDMNAHQSVCGEVIVRCELCDDRMQRFRMQAHQDNDCPRVMMWCGGCGHNVPRYRWERHQHSECQRVC
eukprot:NODE_14_length_4096_cov_369.740549_g12_i0.p1 GENE.NODE_14_length_4096_cov_369.740549_g12_i0~~NODE_14_length_4096_cov_369.740549_g12_i0.p1  ORF type:complete len:592 (+),score=142.80 NODE_14_length_4096_cov_369.740549_g12_i0:55-1830(+)